MIEARSETALQASGLLCGRLLLSIIFVHDGIFKVFNYAASAAYTRAFGVPEQLLPLAIVLELGCGLLIAVGFYTRAAALLLAGFCLFTAAVFHVRFVDRNQLIHFEKNLAMAGGFLMLWASGPGWFSLDRFRVRQADKQP